MIQRHLILIPFSFQHSDSNIWGSVKLIAVSKTKPMDQIKPVIDEGQFHFGENKVQEAV